MAIESEETTVRTTVTIPKLDYDEIEKIAREKRVSVAWVVREAVTEYIGTTVDSDSSMSVGGKKAVKK